MAVHLSIYTDIETNHHTTNNIKVSIFRNTPENQDLPLCHCDMPARAFTENFTCVCNLLKLNMK